MNANRPRKLSAKTQREEVFFGSLKQRAVKLCEDPVYLRKIKNTYKAEKKYRPTLKFVEFPLRGQRPIRVPYSGQKMVAGYLKKESAHLGLLLQKFWQPKYFSLDMFKFELKYAKTPAHEMAII